MTAFETESADIQPSALQEAFDALDLKQVSAWLADSDASRMRSLVECCRRSRSLVQQWSTERRRQQRNEFLRELLRLVDEESGSEEYVTLSRLMDGAATFERAYDEIKAALNELELSRLAQAEQLWAWVERIGVFANQIRQDIERYFRTNKELIDPFALQIKDEEGITYNPDAAWNLAVESVSGALQMLGHRNKLFDAKGVLVLPPPVPSDPQRVKLAEAGQLLAASWNALEKAEQRWRWWGGELRLERKTFQTPNGEVELDHLAHVYELTHTDVLNTIANERLDRYRQEAHREAAKHLKRSFASHGSKVLPLAPSEFISREEAIAAYTLSALLKYDVLKDEREYVGLTFPEWLRGYAALQQETAAATAKEPGAQSFYTLSAEELVRRFMVAGLAEPKARLLIKHLSFSRGSVDLSDAPLLRSSDGNVHLLVPIVGAYDIASIIVSQLSNFRQPIGKKGIGLEQFVRERLTKFGAPCTGFKFKEDGEEYEYDAVFVLDDTLFVIECKNRSIPGTHPRRIYEAFRDAAEHLDQLDRLVEATKQYPHRVQASIGSGVSWSRVVGVVLNGLPWNLGSVGPHFVSDTSAFIRFFQENWMLMGPPENCGPEVLAIWKKSLGRQWTSERPTAEELLRELGNPWQVEFLKGEFVHFIASIPLSQTMVFSRPRLYRQTPSLERMLQHFGLEGEELELLLAAYRAAPSADFF